MEQSRFALRRNRLRTVGARIGYGAAWAALPAGGAVAAGVDGNIALALLFGALAFCASVLAPLAPFIPGLHRLPLVGSPRVEVVFRLNGRRNMTLSVPAGEEHICILEVEITNLERWVEVKGAWLNLLIPSGIKLGRCDELGKEEPGGEWEEFRRHPLGSHQRADSWHDIHWSLPPQRTRRVRIKLRLGHSGEELEYPVLLQLGAPSLYGQLQERGVILVREGEPDLADRIGAHIATGERALGELQQPPVLLHDGPAREIFVDFVANATPLLTEAIAHDPLPQTPGDADATEFDERLQTILTALYVVRDELGRGTVSPNSVQEPSTNSA